MPEPRKSLLPIFNAAPPVSPFHQRLEEIRASLLPLDAAMAVRRFGPEGSARLLKTTISLCPDCTGSRAGPGLRARGPDPDARSGARSTGIRRAAGERRALLSSFQQRPLGPALRRRGSDRFSHLRGDELLRRGGLRSRHGGGPHAGVFRSDEQQNVHRARRGHQRLQSACPVCYSDAKGDRKLPLDAFQPTSLETDPEVKGGLDSVQLTGGEATLHPEFWDMVAFLHAQSGVKKIYLPTNGILFARPELRRPTRPLPRQAHGPPPVRRPTGAANLALRDADTLRASASTSSANLGRLGIHMQLTMTLTQGVNDARSAGSSTPA